MRHDPTSQGQIGEVYGQVNRDTSNYEVENDLQCSDDEKPFLSLSEEEQMVEDEGHLPSLFDFGDFEIEGDVEIGDTERGWI